MSILKKTIICTSAILSLTFVSNANALFSTKYTGSCQLLAKESGKYPEKKVKGYKSESVFKKMQQANQLMADGNKSQARAILMEVKNSSTDGFTLSIVYQYLSRMAYDAGNFNQAVDYARKVVELDALPVNAILGMKKQVAYAYYGKKDYKSTINWLKQYFAQVIKPPVSDYKTLAQLYYQDKQYKNAICPAYIALKKSTKLKDKESLYKMLFGLHYSLKDLKGSANILSEMINFFPEEKKYWEQLYSIHYELGDEISALAVNELAYMKGLWTKEKEVKNLASMHANIASPYNAAKRLQDGVSKGVVSKNEENLKLIAGYWELAREKDKAISAYKNVSQYSKSGKYLYRIGNMYFGSENYKDAINYFQQAISKGGLSGEEAGSSLLQIGAAKFYLGQENAAIQSLVKAQNYTKTKKQATSWIGFIRQKQKIREQLRKDAEEMEASIAEEKAS